VSILFNYKTVKKQAQADIIEKKSRFIAHILPITAEQQAIDFIQMQKSKYYDASHNVYAYILRENNIQRYSDDGEPSGTAGIPTLDVIRKENLVDVCIVVTRYFGGTLLGAGGLVRAYTKAAKAGIDIAGILERKLCYEYTVTADYTLLGKIQNEAVNFGCVFGEVEYKENVVLTFFVPHNIIGFEEKIIDITNRRAIITKGLEGRFIDAN
jgi:uncharacterized YigZ family protein